MTPEERARLYLERSNRGELDAIFAMFADDVIYESTQVGSHQGRTSVETMMRSFFGRFPDAHWDVDSYREEAGPGVVFDFVMRGTDAETGERVERRGTERVTFGADGLIRRVAVDVA